MDVLKKDAGNESSSELAGCMRTERIGDSDGSSSEDDREREMPYCVLAVRFLETNEPEC